MMAMRKKKSLKKAESLARKWPPMRDNANSNKYNLKHLRALKGYTFVHIDLEGLPQDTAHGGKMVA